MKFSEIFTALIKPKKKEKKLNEWGEEEKPQEKTVNPSSFTYFLKANYTAVHEKLASISKHPVQFHGRFLKIKRYFSMVSSLVCLLMGLFAIPNPISLVFLGWSYLHLDYVWKTRNVWIVREVKNNA